MSEGKKCNICTIFIEPKSDVISLGCGHIFHLTCYNFTRNIMTYCLICVPPKLSLLGNLKQDKITQFPISFGDDERVDVLAKQRAVLIQKFGFPEKSGQSIKLSKIRKQIGVDDDPNDPKSKSLSTAMNYFKNFTHMVTADPSSKSYVESQNVTQWIMDRQKSTWLAERGIDGHVLYSNGITIKTLFDNGYLLDDFILMKITWDNMLNLGFKQAEIFLECKDKEYFTIEHLNKIWGVTSDKILTDICGCHLTLFAKLKFTKEELKILKFNFSLFIIYGKKFTTAKFFNLSVQDWKELGMTPEKIKSMSITSDTFKTIFQISNSEYKDIFEEGIELLDNVNKVPFKVPPSFDTYWDDDMDTHNPALFEIGN